jgi:hypothetical protein
MRVHGGDAQGGSATIHRSGRVDQECSTSGTAQMVEGAEESSFDAAGRSAAEEQGSSGQSSSCPQSTPA